MVGIKKLKYISLLLYLIGISAFQLGTGFDAIFVRLSFVILIGVCVFLRMKIRITSHLKWCLVFWVFYYLSMIWASNASDTLYYINNTIQIIGISICFTSIIENEDDIDEVIKLIIFSMFFTSVRLIVYTPVSAWGTERIGEAIGQNPNGLGMRLAIAAVMCLYMLHRILEKQEKKKIQIIIFVSMLVFFTVITMFTGSKKSIAILILGLASYEVITTRGWRFLAKILLIIVLVMIVIYLIFNNEMLYKVLGRRIERTLLTLQGTATGLSVDMSLRERNFYIEKAKELFCNYPVLGYGGNNFVAYMREINYSHIAYCHNNFFEILSTLGVVGFFIYYFEWAIVELKLVRRYSRRKSKRALLFGIIIIIELVMDYWNVSYISDFTQILLIMGFLTIKTENREIRNC